jgi:hypothetical protein
MDRLKKIGLQRSKHTPQGNIALCQRPFLVALDS